MNARRRMYMFYYPSFITKSHLSLHYFFLLRLQSGKACHIMNKYSTNTTRNCDGKPALFPLTITKHIQGKVNSIPFSKFSEMEM
jgi:hypothetical protein